MNYFNTDIVAYNDYYPGGMAMPNRNIEGNYRYGYQGEYAEKEPELGQGINSFELRLYDSRINRWISPDPYRQYASPYLGMGNNWINGVDPDGGCFTTDTDGNTIPCPDTGVGSTMTGSAGLEWTMQEDGWALSDANFAQYGSTITVYTLNIYRDTQTNTSTTSTFNFRNISGFMLEPPGPDTTTPSWR